MIMSYLKYESLVSEFPAEHDTIHKLQALFDSSNIGVSYSIGRLIDKVAPQSTYYFPTLLRRAEEENLIKRLVRVESPFMGHIQDFNSISEVPDEIYDQHQGKYILVTPNLIKAVYRPATK